MSTVLEAEWPPMGGERVNTSRIAEKVGKEIFSVFGWEQRSLKNKDFTCLKTVQHHKIKAKTHSTDAVFKYQDPYSGRDIYVNTDLKSYGTATAEKFSIEKTLKNIGHSTECANVSSEWKGNYVDETRNHDVIGMLFVYNHEGQADDSFTTKLANVLPSRLALAPDAFIGVIGPARAVYLNSISKDIKVMQADGDVPEKTRRYFIFPHLNRTKAIFTHSRAASLQSLLSPIIVLGFDSIPSHGSAAPQGGRVIYYDGRGSSIDEFKYLLDYLFKYQIAADGTPITVKLCKPTSDAALNFGKAKDQYARDHWSATDGTRDEVARVLDSITYKSAQLIIQTFDINEIGMEKD